MKPVSMDHSNSHKVDTTKILSEAPIASAGSLQGSGQGIN